MYFARHYSVLNSRKQLGNMYKMDKSFTTSIAAMALMITFGSAAGAQNVIVYPKEGQSQEDMDFDRFQCGEWATSQTGFDPTNPQASAANVQADPNAGQGTAARGTARGAAGGAAVGAIAGDAGKGAAIGATVGLMRGARSKRQQKAAAEQQAAQATADSIAYAQQSYDRALKACLEGRGYSVQ